MGSILSNRTDSGCVTCSDPISASRTASRFGFCQPFSDLLGPLLTLGFLNRYGIFWGFLTRRDRLRRPTLHPTELLPSAERENPFARGTGLPPVAVRLRPLVRRFMDEVFAADVRLFAELLGQGFRNEPLTPRFQVRRRAELLAEAETCLLRLSGPLLRLGRRSGSPRQPTTSRSGTCPIPGCRRKPTLVTPLAVQRGFRQRSSARLRPSPPLTRLNPQSAPHRSPARRRSRGRLRCRPAAAADGALLEVR